MPKSRSQAQKREWVRIVPLATPEVIKKTAAAQAAHLTYNNGPLVAQAEVFTVFWGSAWQQASLAGTISEINGFFDFILTSSLIDQLAEYSVSQYQIGHGKTIGSVTLTSPDVAKTVDDPAIQKMIQQQIAAGRVSSLKSQSHLLCFSAVGGDRDAAWLSVVQGVLRLP
jgi:hypothetical protein